MTETQEDDFRQDFLRSEAKASFNQAWDLIDRGERSSEDDAQMLLAACASRYLWGMVGGVEQRAIGDWQVAHVASLMGDAPLALRFASTSLDAVRANGWTDWRLASALEGMARAHAAAGDSASRDRYAARCREVLATIEDPEDRELIESQLASIPGI